MPKRKDFRPVKRTQQLKRAIIISSVAVAIREALKQNCRQSIMQFWILLDVIQQWLMD
uniref:Uncharacterized protein n=1 Tax=Romanomermis culicivorax TaxID=13658 RepID=A0A915KIM8_ROMCU